MSMTAPVPANFFPIRIRSDPTTSKMIASTIAICGNGIPTHAAIATDPSNPVIFPYAEKRKRMARRSRAKKFVYGIYSKKEIKVSPIV